jgi:uncharacterized protein
LREISILLVFFRGVKRRATGVARLCAALVLAAVSAAAQGFELPPSTGFVNDFAGVVDAASRDRMETMARNFRDRTQIEIAVVTVASLQGRSKEDVGLQIGREWGVGAGAEKSGLVILLAPQERQSYIAVSRHLEDEITDGTAGAISRKATPYFREGKYGPGLSLMLESVLATIADKQGISIEGIDQRQAYREERPPPRASGSPWVSRIITLLIVLFVIYSFSRGGGGGYGGRRRRYYGPSPWIIPGVFWGGGGGSRGGFGGGGWGGGGGGGGGGWGGFGGGGDFGGGGGGDSW